MPKLSKKAAHDPETMGFIQEALRHAIELELVGILQYMWQHVIAEGLSSPAIADAIRRISIEEMKHAESLAEQLNFFGVTDLPTKVSSIKLSTSPSEQLRHNIETEKEAIGFYEGVIDVLLDISAEHGTRQLFESILHDEENHLNIFESTLGV